MKFQCSVCGQIINTNESCPICGSNKDKIISLGDDENSVTYRCLSCGRVFENRDVCPYCGGEDLFDLTHDKIFNRNEVKPQKEEEKPVEDEELDLFSSFSNLNEEDKFEDKPVELSKVEIKVEEPEEEKTEDPFDDEETLIKEDDYENGEIITNYEDLDDEEDKKIEKESENFESSEEEKVDDVEGEFPFDYDFDEEDEKSLEENNDEELVNDIDEDDDSPFSFYEENNEETMEEEKTLIEENVEFNEDNSLNEVVKEEENEVKEEKAEEPISIQKEESTIDKTALYNEILLNILLSPDVKIETSSELINKVLSSLKEEVEALKLYKNEDLINLMNKKLEIDKEIFKKDASPLNGHILYEDELIISKFKKD